jgi:NAD(P)-dependent dehydrogenase (short-subunit alcohol dehydrogenase family)
MKNKHVLLTGGTGGLGLGATPAVLAQETHVTLAYIKDVEVERFNKILSPNTKDCCSSLNHPPLSS